MNQQVGDRVRWIVFAGLPMVAMALLACLHDSLARALGENLAPYVGLGMAAVVWILSLVLYDRLPKWLILPIGILGWIVTLSIGYWFLNHGPRSF